MFVRRSLARTFFILFVGLTAPWGLVAQTDQTEDLLSDAVRLLRIEMVIERDQEKLNQVRGELGLRTSAFEHLGEEGKRLARELEETQLELDSLGEMADAEARSALEGKIQILESALDLYKTQLEVEFTTETTLRQQIQTLEKKIDREQRTIVQLRGVAAAEPGEMASVLEAAPPPAPTATSPPLGIPSVPAPSAVEPMPSHYATTAQIEAQREVERLEADVRQAETTVLEFVKRQESLKQLIQLEEVLLDSAQRSSENLDKTLGVAQSRLESRIAAGTSQEDLEKTRSFIALVEGRIEATRLEIEDRAQYLVSLEKRLEKLQDEERTVVEQREESQRRVKAARRHLNWLQSPIHPSNLLEWARVRGPRILFVLVVAGLVLVVLRLTVRRVARLTIRRRRGERTLTTNRADTLALSVRSALSALIILAALILVFEEAGVNLTTLLGGAAILGFAFAFGAQNLMRDYFTGFMILIEDQYELGDLVTIGSITGTVEKVNMRTTVLRDLEGRVHFIPNGEVKSVTNRTYVWGRAVVEVPVGYKENVDRVIGIITEIVQEFKTDPDFASWVTDEPVVLGVDRFTEFGVVIKFMVKTPPDKMFAARRELLRRTKNRFDEEGIEIFVPRRRMI